MAMSRPQVTDDAHECHGLGGRLSEEIKAWRVYVRAVFVRRRPTLVLRSTYATWRAGRYASAAGASRAGS